MVGFRIRERSLHVAEKFTFEKRFRDGAGVHADHWLVRPSGKSVDFVREDILAGAVFAGNEHCGICRGDTFHVMPELLHP